MLVDRVFEFLRPALTLQSVFLALGAEDASLALRAAGYAERVYSVDTAVTGRPRPPNIVQLSSGRGIPLPAGSVDVAFGHDFSRLREIHAVLAPGGEYHCFGGLPELFREAGFSKSKVYIGMLRVPFAVARNFDYRAVAVK